MPAKTAVVLAAGMGTRMKSELPKVLVEVCSRPMILYVLDALAAGGIERTIVVVGYRAELVRQTLKDRPGVEFALQAERLGTGHAVMCCRDLLAEYDGPVMVVAGDSPLMRAESIAALLAEFERSPAAAILGTAHKPNPEGLGRILRNEQADFVGIVEEKDATERQRKITEVNLSYYVFNCRDLLPTLDQLRSDNAQGEYYITDSPGVLVAQGKEVRALPVLQPCEALTINTFDQLAAVEAEMNHSSKPPV